MGRLWPGSGSFTAVTDKAIPAPANEQIALSGAKARMALDLVVEREETADLVDGLEGGA